MKFSLRLTGLLLIFCAFQFTAIAQQQTVTIQPEQPAPDETVTITYHPESPDALIEPADSLKLILSFAPYLYSQPGEMEMKKTDNGWKTTFELSEQFKFASFYFESAGKTDKNSDGHHFEFFAYENGKPVSEAYIMKARSLEERYKDSSDSTLAEMKADLYQQELDVYPHSYRAQLFLWAHQMDQPAVDKRGIREKAYPVIDRKLSTDPSSYAVISDVKWGYRTIGEEAKGDSVEKAMIERYPKSDIAMYDLYRKASDEEDKDKQAEMYLEYVNADYERSLVNKHCTERAQENLFEYYAEEGNVKKMEKWAQRWLNPEQPLLKNPIKSSLYNRAARTIAEHTNSYNLALQYAQKALQLTESEPAVASLTTSGRIVRYLPEDRSQKIKENRKNNILATLGYIHLSQDQYEKAEEYLTRTKESDSDYAHKNLAKLYLKTERPTKAYDIYWDMLMDEPTDEEVRAQLKEAYIARNGSEQGFKNETEKLDEAWRQQMIKKLNEERKDKETPSLKHITDLEGNPINTEKLKNKVVVIDFWATWCGPCLSAFPYVQKIYDEYKDNADVEFVILNSAWSNTIEDARKWQKENDYTFPLYYDKDSKVTEAFGVRGIPTTFFIGKNGNIQFEKVGFEGPAMEPKMKLQIEMLLEDKPLSVKAPSQE